MRHESGPSGMDADPARGRNPNPDLLIRSYRTYARLHSLGRSERPQTYTAISLLYRPSDFQEALAARAGASVPIEPGELGR